MALRKRSNTGAVGPNSGAPLDPLLRPPLGAEPRSPGLRSRWLESGSTAWRELLSGCAHDAYHDPEYVALEAARIGGEPTALVVDDGACGLLLPLVLRPITPVLGADFAGIQDAVSPYGYPGPIVIGRFSSPEARSGWEREACRAALIALRERNVCSAFVRLHPMLEQPIEALRESGTIVEHGPTVWLDLQQDDERYWSQLRENHRRVIRRLKRAGFTAEIETSDGALADFTRLYHETMRFVGAGPSYFFSPEYLAKLRHVLGDGIHLCGVRLRGELVAGGLFLECGGLVQYHLGATAAAHRSSSPSRLMLDYARSWARARGNTQLHLGGGLGASVDSLFHFKAGFSPLRAGFATWRVIADPERYAAATRRWEVLHGERSLGDVGFFPEYRRPPPVMGGCASVL